MLEKDIEKYLRDEIKAIGGRAFKFVSPGNAGVPDRLITLPGGLVAFAELKAPGKKTTELQAKQIKRLQSLGFKALVVDSKSGVDELVTFCKGMMQR